MTLKLYYAPFTRATRPRWMLEEIGAPYELVRLNLKEGEHKRPAYLDVHPHGSVPALVDGDVTIIESAAICAYLADRFPAARMAPETDRERAAYHQWLFYGMATLEPVVAELWAARKDPSPSESVQKARERFAVSAAFLARALEGRSHLVGERLTTADVVIGAILVWAASAGLLDGHPQLAEYASRMKGRPAFVRARAD